MERGDPDPDDIDEEIGFEDDIDTGSDGSFVDGGEDESTLVDLAVNDAYADFITNSIDGAPWRRSAR